MRPHPTPRAFSHSRTRSNPPVTTSVRMGGAEVAVGGRRRAERFEECRKIGGVLTFKNSGLGDVLSKIDLEHIILETDSPYLSPMPHRGKRNEPSYTRLVAEKLADVKGVSLFQVAEVTTRNAERLFGI